MELNQLTAISPIDGRYRKKIKTLSNYFSELALIKYRIKIEVEYFISLVELKINPLLEFEEKKNSELRNLYKKFNQTDALKVKEIEAKINHDVKAVEYFIKDKFKNLNLEKYSEFIHFGLTSQDINNTAIPLSLKDAINEEYLPLLNKLILKLNELSNNWKNIPLLAKTHGQPASPTRFGKEIEVFTKRLEIQINQFLKIPFSAKFGGATGNFNAHVIAYPKINWLKFGDNFVNKKLGLKRSYPTTQIEHYDNMASIFDSMKRINNILMDLSRDIWMYISMNYLSQKINSNEIGSSAMPHKINPIDFENAEGNIGIANSFFEHLSSKLPISRLQRDLTDSTVLRNIGIPISHSMIAFINLLNGLNKISPNKLVIKNDLNDNWVVIAEAIQTILRRENYPNPYETLKNLTRTNKKITKKSLHEFIDSLNLDINIKHELKLISPHNYTGI
jgi:adenylosuccinate lyase